MLTYIEDFSYMGCYAIFVRISRRFEDSYRLRLRVKTVQEVIYP